MDSCTAHVAQVEIDGSMLTSAICCWHTVSYWVGQLSRQNEFRNESSIPPLAMSLLHTVANAAPAVSPIRLQSRRARISPTPNTTVVGRRVVDSRVAVGVPFATNPSTHVACRATIVLSRSPVAGIVSSACRTGSHHPMHSRPVMHHNWHAQPAGFGPGQAFTAATSDLHPRPIPRCFCLGVTLEC